MLTTKNESQRIPLVCYRVEWTNHKSFKCKEDSKSCPRNVWHLTLDSTSEVSALWPWAVHCAVWVSLLWNKDNASLCRFIKKHIWYQVPAHTNIYNLASNLTYNSITSRSLKSLRDFDNSLRSDLRLFVVITFFIPFNVSIQLFHCPNMKAFIYRVLPVYSGSGN